MQRNMIHIVDENKTKDDFAYGQITLIYNRNITWTQNLFIATVYAWSVMCFLTWMKENEFKKIKKKMSLASLYYLDWSVVLIFSVGIQCILLFVNSHYSEYGGKHCSFKEIRKIQPYCKYSTV